MAIPAAAEFLFCRFQQLSEIRYFLSNRQSEGPLSRCFSLFLFTSGNLTPSGTPIGPPTGTHTRYAYDGPGRRPACGSYLSALATSKAWSRVNAAREIVAAGVSGEW
eukprot:COSAG01_NODE_202_length_22130_cov_167.927239_1_plen_107_part_00